MTVDGLSVAGRAGSRPGQYIVEARGAITFGRVAVLQDAVRAAQGSSLILDLTQVPYIDSAALGGLVHAHVSCRKAGRRLALVGPSRRVQALLQLTQVGQLFDIFPTVGVAEQTLA